MDYEYIIQQVKKFHYSGWNDEELRKCVDMLPGLTREQQVSLYRSKWIEHEKTLKDAIFHLLFNARIEERDKKIKAMNVDELIENLHDENGNGKFIVLEMKERYDSLEDADKVKNGSSLPDIATWLLSPPHWDRVLRLQTSDRSGQYCS